MKLTFKIAVLAAVMAALVVLASASFAALGYNVEDGSGVHGQAPSAPTANVTATAAPAPAAAVVTPAEQAELTIVQDATGGGAGTTTTTAPSHSKKWYRATYSGMIKYAHTHKDRFVSKAQFDKTIGILKARIPEGDGVSNDELDYLASCGIWPTGRLIALLDQRYVLKSEMAATTGWGRLNPGCWFAGRPWLGWAIAILVGFLLLRWYFSRQNNQCDDSKEYPKSPQYKGHKEVDPTADLKVCMEYSERDRYGASHRAKYEPAEVVKNRDDKRYEAMTAVGKALAAAKKAAAPIVAALSPGAGVAVVTGTGTTATVGFPPPSPPAVSAATKPAPVAKGGKGKTP